MSGEDASHQSEDRTVHNTPHTDTDPTDPGPIEIDVVLKHFPPGSQREPNLDLDYLEDDGL